MNKLDKDYQELLLDIMTNGVTKMDRTGTGTLSVFGRQIRHRMSDGFPVITTKKMYWKGIVTELIWFLRGDTSIKYLVDNDCHIWDGDAYKNYCKHFMDEYLEKNELGEFYRNSLIPHPIEEFINKIKTDDEFAKKWANLGPIYGSQWRKWKFTDKFTNGEQIAYVNGKIDQIQNLINDLKTNPDSRRLLVSAWNPADLPHQVLPPCFTEDMMVACVDGYRKISELTTNDLVLTEDGSYQKVYELHETNYKGDLLKIKTHANNKSINVTPNHPFLVKDKGYVNASEITKNDYLGIPINKNEIIPSFKTIIKDNQYSEKEIETVLDDKDYWYLMGYFLGDGWLINSKKEIYFTINNNQVDEVLPRLNKIIGLAKLNNSGLNCKKYVGRKQQLFEILTMFGKYAYGKFIPQFVHDAPKYLIEEFLKGYQRADGCITKDGINYTTISDDIAYGLQLLYAKLNIKASIYYQKRLSKKIIEGREVKQKNTYSINVYKQKNKSKNYIFDTNYLWLHVNDIEKTNYDGFVYNISTENNHTYNVFNLVNHNCHYGFQVWTRELSDEERIKLLVKLENPKGYEGVKITDTVQELLTINNIPTRAISLMWNQRSVDTGLGLPYNITSYALLLTILGKMTNMIPEELIGNLGDTHIYSDHIDGLKEQLTREPYQLPTLKINSGNENWHLLELDEVLNTLDPSLTFKLENYQSHPTIKLPLSN